MNGLAQQAIENYQSNFGFQPKACGIAPGRVNLIGEHLDYNHGWVLPFAIDRYTVVVLGPPVQSDRFTIKSSLMDQAETFGLESMLDTSGDDWTNYFRGVLAGFMKLGKAPEPLSIFVHSEIPIGSGLSSSAALEVAFASALEAYWDLALDPVAKAKLCQRAEQEFVGVPCGIMDQLVSTLGVANACVLIDCSDNTHRYIRIRSDDWGFLLINTKVSHSLASSEYAARFEQCRNAAKQLGVRSLREFFDQGNRLETDCDDLNGDQQKRVRHVLTETQRVLDCVTHMEPLDAIELGRLMYASHQSLKNDYNVSCRELDFVVDSALRIGVEGGIAGARMTGGGFGGCVIALVSLARADEIRSKLDSCFAREFGYQPECFMTVPSHGAEALKLGRPI